MPERYLCASRILRGVASAGYVDQSTFLSDRDAEWANAVRSVRCVFPVVNRGPLHSCTSAAGVKPQGPSRRSPELEEEDWVKAGVFVESLATEIIPEQSARLLPLWHASCCQLQQCH